MIAVGPESPGCHEHRGDPLAACPDCRAEYEQAKRNWPIGRSRSPGISSDHVERRWWIGKPWRRVELRFDDYFWKGERCEREWELSLQLGIPRLGWHIGCSLIRSHYDYSEEER